MPHTQGTHGIQGNSGNFQVEENLREFWFVFETLGNFDFFLKFREVLRIYKYQEILLLDLEWDIINLVQCFVQEN